MGNESGMLGDKRRIGSHTEPFPYWANPDHIYQANELIICAIQYACPEEDIGFRYENSLLIWPESCEMLLEFPLAVEEV